MRRDAAVLWRVPACSGHARPDGAALGAVVGPLAERTVAVTVARTFPLEQVREAQHFAQIPKDEAKQLSEAVKDIYSADKYTSKLASSVNQEAGAAA